MLYKRGEAVYCVMNLAARSHAKLILCQCIMGFYEWEILHEVFGTLWQYEIQSKAWQMRLMQPIYKGGDKSRADPASYRGIYLSSALAKLFEGILISRLTKFTETHNTLTENQPSEKYTRYIVVC